MKATYKDGKLSGSYALNYDSEKSSVAGQYTLDTEADEPTSSQSGEWTAWYADGTKASIIDYTKGLATFLNPDGTTWMSTKSVDGKWWDEGQSLNASGAFKDGQLQGDWTRAYPDGRKLDVTGYKKGQRHGKYKSWHATGTVRTEGQYKNGLAVGQWASWGRYGNLESVICFRDGNKVWTAFEAVDSKRKCP